MTRKQPGLIGLGVAAFVASFAVGCQGSGSFAQLQEKLATIEQKQDTILSKVDELGKKVEAMPAGAAPGAPNKPAAPRPGRPDPKATYKVAVSPDDSAKGPADAKITVVEWSDYQ